MYPKSLNLFERLSVYTNSANYFACLAHFKLKNDKQGNFIISLKEIIIRKQTCWIHINDEVGNTFDYVCFQEKLV